MENHLGELWSVMRFALPELLGEGRSFSRAFRRPIEKDGSEAARRELVKRLVPFVLRRRKEQVAAELPPKTIVVESVELDDDPRDVYEAVRAAMDERVRQALVERASPRATSSSRMRSANFAKRSAKILALQEKKRALFTSVIDDGVGAAKGLTESDVAFLFAR